MTIDPDRLQEDLTIGLQVERTSLAWSRTMMVLAAIFGLIAVHSLVTTMAWPLAIAASAAAAVILASATLVTHRRLHSLHQQIRRHAAVNATVQSLVLTCVALAASALALIAIITQQ